MEEFLLDYHLLVENATSLGKLGGVKIAGTMMLEAADITGLERHSVLATTQRSLDFY